VLDFFLTAKFWFGLVEIAFLNLLLSGDNALVIALAVRALPRRERILGQVWGAVGAVILRLVFVGIITYLLNVPFLQFVGGLLLVWIAFKLVQSESGAEGEVRHGVSLWDAIWIIIVADVTMSLDNVLAIAAAARGDLLLIMFGIGLSLPIVVWGAGIIARLMNRYPWIVWLGGGILGKVAGEMIIEDQIIEGWLGDIAKPMHYTSPIGVSFNLHPFPIVLGVVIALIGWWLAHSHHAAHRVPEDV
jgi:YjbE family integral membrane protein